MVCGEFCEILCHLPFLFNFMNFFLILYFGEFDKNEVNDDTCSFSSKRILNIERFYGNKVLSIYSDYNFILFILTRNWNVLELLLKL